MILGELSSFVVYRPRLRKIVMLNRGKELLAIAVFVAGLFVFSNDYVYAQEGWFKPFLSVREEYDDNIYLTDTNEKSDWITTVSPGFTIEPRTTKHKFTFDYYADLKFFADCDGENNYNHTTNAEAQFLFNKVRLGFANTFRYFSEQAGSEDTNRVDRTQDYVRTLVTFDFNKLDLSLGYNYKLENYRSNAAIGAFRGQALTYKDLERNEHEGEIEAAFKLWPKTALLFSGIYGTIDHDTGKKSDSDYFDVLTGLRGQPTAKCAVEGKIGYRAQDYKDYDNDFESLIFEGSLIEDFTSRDTLRLDFLRISNETNYKDNAYYKNTFFGAGYTHGFTDKVSGSIDFSYQRNSYPTETTETGKTDKREDDFWSYGIGVSYELSKWLIADVKYEYLSRNSNFSTFDYKNNRVSTGFTGSF